MHLDDGTTAIVHNIQPASKGIYVNYLFHGHEAILKFDV